ncbi:MAG TPA: ABC transporter permease [Candidatus Hydrogenedentes bacterium]|nr:ABC transporter permease [Candidatus Hydrogenedentota bacterium]
MSLWHIAWSYLWNRKLTTALTILSVALGVGLIVSVLTLREETQRRFEQEGQAFDLVVGAKGNPLQLVLSTVYFLDVPTGNIRKDILDALRDMEDVEAAYPVAMGDTYRGFRIIGTVPDLMRFQPGGSQPYALAEGRYWERPMEAVIGAQVAEASGLRIGDTFKSTHGFIQVPGADEHEEQYTVVGILRRSGTPNDRAIFCGIESVWDLHAHHDEEHEAGHEHHHPEDEVTAVLVKLASPALRFEYRDRINRNFNAMAAIPIQEIQKLYEQLLGTAKAVLLAIGYLVVVISAMSILIGLYMAILQRRRDLAIMRALGATRGEIFGSVLIEAFWVTLLGIAAGQALGMLVCAALGRYLTQRLGFHLSAVVWSPDLVSALSAVLLMGMLAGILPAWQAYRTDVARDLAEP